jgi:hypothetical protein
MVHTKKLPTIRKVAAGLCVLAVLGYGYFYLMSTTTSGGDILECNAIAKFVESSQSFPQSISVPGRPAFFCDADVRGVLMRRFDHIRIYGVVDNTEQNSVIETLKRTHEHLKTRPILVDFYEKENWKTWSSPATGNSGGERGPETPVRTVAIR